MLKKICCFFFVFALMCVHVSAQPKVLYVSGETVMINAQYDGVFISGTFEFQWNNQIINNHPSDSIQPGDLIISYENTEINQCADLNRIIASQSIQVSSIPVTVLRNGQKKNARLYLYFDSQEHTFKTGFYIKDHISGVGTLTYYDPVNQSYAALGHEITEKTTNQTADIHQGSIALGHVIQIEPSLMNQPGEKVSRSTGKQIGNIMINNQFGLYGKYTVPSSYRIMEIAAKGEIKPGKASILTVIEGTEVQEVEIQITEVNLQNEPDIKGIELMITDQNLISETGGIVQGMSGSPIIQNGKIVGAVTHMIPSSPHKGYGIFIEWMLNVSNQL